MTDRVDIMIDRVYTRVIDRVFCKDDHVLGFGMLVCARHVSAVRGVFIWLRDRWIVGKW